MFPVAHYERTDLPIRLATIIRHIPRPGAPLLRTPDSIDLNTASGMNAVRHAQLGRAFQGGYVMS